MKNYEVFENDPRKKRLLNEGVAKVGEQETGEQQQTLRYELETFVCQGEYRKGLERILNSYVQNLGSQEQPGVWVSGFYGSGKSHLVKMLRYLWQDYEFEDGATARGIAELHRDVADSLAELSTAGARAGGLHAAAGALGSSPGSTVRKAILSVIFRSAGLPAEYPKARFVMWLRKEGYYDTVRSYIEEAGENFREELDYMWVSRTLAEALLEADPDFADSHSDVRSHLKNEFPRVDDVSDEQMVKGIRHAIAPHGKFPCTLVVLDEVGQYIDEDSGRCHEVQLATEVCTKRFGSKLLFVATGQSALTGARELPKLQGRFPLSIELSDTDVEKVTREVVLAKDPAKQSAVQDVIEECRPEIDRHLVDSEIGPRSRDDEFLVPEYPLLPVRRRFWENVLRAVDTRGTTSQLRTQLRIIDDAVKAIAGEPLGTVVPADFIFDANATKMVQSGALLRQINDLIIDLKDGDEDEQLKGRLCALAYLISELPQKGAGNIGVRAVPGVFADLLVEDLEGGSTELRRRIPELLEELVDEGHLMLVEDEYLIQTEESRVWNHEYQTREDNIRTDSARIASERSDMIRESCQSVLSRIKLTQGESQTSRSISIAYGPEPPEPTGSGVPVWVRDEWSVSASSAQNDAREAGTDDPVVHVFLPRRSPEELKKAIARKEAAQETLDVKGTPRGPEGKEARAAMETRRDDAEETCESIISRVLEHGRVFMGGGDEVSEGLMLYQKVKNATGRALKRLYPRFDEGDDGRWDKALRRAKRGDTDALQHVGHSGEVENHPVCREILSEVNTWSKGSKIRKTFEGGEYGWPRDAIDTSLLVLVATGRVRARYGNDPQRVKDLNRRKMGKVEFQAETTVISTVQRVKLRGLFQVVHIDCTSGQESQVAGQFLEQMESLARQAGDEPPWPEPPSTSHIRRLKSLSGNGQLQEIYDMRKRLKQEAETWKAISQKIVERKPRWETLRILLGCAEGLPVADEVSEQMEAIRQDRAALDNPDPVPPLCKKLSKALRDALTDVRQQYEDQWEEEKARLESDSNWQSLDEARQQSLLSQYGVKDVPDIEVGTEQELIDSLRSISLREWSTRVDALPTKFQKIKMAAARENEPQSVSVSLPSGTLHDADEVDDWLEQVRRTLLEKLDDDDTDAVILN